MAIQVQCRCGRTFSVREEFAGRTGTCPACGTGVTVPRPAAREDDGLLPLDLPPPPSKHTPGCHAHPRIPPRGACSICAKLLCVRCVCEIDGAIYCQSCMTTAGAFRGGQREKHSEGLVTKSYKSYFNASKPLAALGSARLTVMDGWVLWALMVGLTLLFVYLKPISAHYTRGTLVPYVIGLVQLFALIFLECAFVASIRDALFQKEFGIARFFHYGARYFLRYLPCALAFWGTIVGIFVLLSVYMFVSGGGGIPAMLGFLAAVVGVSVLFAYARILVVLENAGPIEAFVRGLTFAFRHAWKVLVLALLCGGVGVVAGVKGAGLFFFLPDWLGEVVRNLFVFLAIGTQIAASMVLYLSLLPEEGSFRRVLPPDDVPETNGPLAVRVSLGAFLGVIVLAWWVDRIGEEASGRNEVINELGDRILQAARPKAKVVWNLDAKEPVLAGPVAVGTDVLACLADRMERRRGADGSLVWKAELPGRAATPPVHDGERAYVVCLWIAPKTDEFPYGEPKNTLVAIVLSDGSRAWTVQMPRASDRWPQPELAGDLLIVPSHHQMHAFSRADGREVWATPEGTVFIAHSPARAADDGIYFASQNDKIHVVDRSDGHELRSIPYPRLSLLRKPVVTPDSVYTTAGNTVIRLDRRSGREVWNYNLGEDELNAESMRIEVLDGVPLFHFVCELRTLDPKNGQVLWILDTGGQYQGLDRDGRQVLTEEFLAQGFAIDGKSLIVIANEGKLMGRVDLRTGQRRDHAELPYLPARSPAEEEEREEVLLEHLDLGGVGTSGDPVIVGRTLIYANGGRLYAVELP